MLARLETFVTHHWLLCVTFLAVLIALIIEEIKAARAQGNFLSSLAVTQLINHENAIILDVRDPALFRTGHILNAKNMPIADFDRQAEKLDASRPLVLVDAMGDKLSPLLAKLSALGFQRIYALKGGMSSWKMDGMPVSMKE